VDRDLQTIYQNIKKKVEALPDAKEDGGIAL
jgi:hypothetical protein